MANSPFETYHLTSKTIVMSRTLAQIEQLVRYFAEDLEQLVYLAKINLAEEFGFPPEYPSSNQEVIAMLYDDLAHMLRDSLITGIHLLLSEPQVDPNTGFYLVRYHAHYTIYPQTSDVSPILGTRFGGRVVPAPDVWQGARFALLIDWSPLANERRPRVRRPEYWFDWVPDEAHFDITNLIHYRDDHLAVDSASVLQRTEAAFPGYVPDGSLRPPPNIGRGELPNRNPQPTPPNIGRGELPDRKSLKAEEAPLSLYALARVVLEEDDKALVGRTYSAQVGVSRTKPEGFTGALFDIPSHDITVPLTFDLLIHANEYIKLNTDWLKKLLFDPHEMQPQLVEFTFQVVAQGRGSLSIDFYHERRWLRTVRIEFDSIEQLQDSTVLSEV